MDDLGTALNENPDMIFMGGGNPGRIPEAEAIFKKRLEAVLQDPQQLHSLMGIYQSPQGDKLFLNQIASLLRKEFGWTFLSGTLLSLTAVNRRFLFYTTC